MHFRVACVIAIWIGLVSSVELFDGDFPFQQRAAIGLDKEVFIIHESLRPDLTIAPVLANGNPSRYRATVRWIGFVEIDSGTQVFDDDGVVFNLTQFLRDTDLQNPPNGWTSFYDDFSDREVITFRTTILGGLLVEFETTLWKQAVNVSFSATREGLPWNHTLSTNEEDVKFSWKLTGPSSTFHPDATVLEVQHVLQHSEAVILVVKKKDYRKHFKVAKEKGDFPNLKHIVILGDKPYDSDMMSWDTFMRLGQRMDKEEELNRRIAAVTEDDTAVMIYSPGTEGYPKGVLLTHKNVVWTSNNVVTSFGFRPEDRYVSFLSQCHIGEQVLAVYTPIIVGHVVYFSPIIRDLHKSLRELQPTILAGPPELWITFYASLHPVIPDGAKGLDKVVIRKLRNRIGCERVRVALIGQKSTPLKIFSFFNSIGIDLLEVYGQLETTGLTTLNRRGRMKPGTVGRPCPKCDVKVSVRGEVMVRGPNVFKGYHRNETGTEETLKDGWLLTGDRGDLREGHLYIPGRLRDEIQTKDGLKVYPATLETQLRALDLIRYALVVGDSKEYLCTVLVVDPVISKRLAKESGVGEATTFIASPEVQKLVSEHIERLNDEEARIPIRKFTISSKVTGLKSNRGEVTPTMNMRRGVLKKVFEKEINAFYAGIAPQMGVELVETTSTILARGGKLTDGYFYLKVGDTYRRTKLQQQEVEDLQDEVRVSKEQVRNMMSQIKHLQEEVGDLSDDEGDGKKGKDKGKEKGKKGLLKKGGRG